MIVSGPASQLLASRLARYLGDEIAFCEYSSFPDGEAYLRVEGRSSDGVVIVQSTPTDRDIIYLLQLLDIFQDVKVNLFIPYFGYARQDKQFHEGEPLSARVIAKAIDASLHEASRIYTVNVHAKSVANHFDHDAKDLDATPILAEKLKPIELLDPVVIAPDQGALGIAQVAASRLGVEYDYLQKTRFSGTQVSISPKEIDVAGRDVVIMDDMISTGGTMAEAISVLKAQGALRIYLAAVHPVLTGNALIKLYRAGVETIITTDALERAVSKVSVAPLLADALYQHWG